MNSAFHQLSYIYSWPLKVGVVLWPLMDGSLAFGKLEFIIPLFSWLLLVQWTCVVFSFQAYSTEGVALEWVSTHHIHAHRALSALAHWSSIFGETEFLPGLIFPFVKQFQNNQLITFEILASILSKCLVYTQCLGQTFNRLGNHVCSQAMYTYLFQAAYSYTHSCYFVFLWGSWLVRKLRLCFQPCSHE